MPVWNIWIYIYHKYLKTLTFPTKNHGGWPPHVASKAPPGPPNPPHICSVTRLQEFVLLVFFRAIPVAHPTQLGWASRMVVHLEIHKTRSNPPPKKNTSKLETWENMGKTCRISSANSLLWRKIFCRWGIKQGLVVTSQGLNFFDASNSLIPII